MNEYCRNSKILIIDNQHSDWPALKQALHPKFCDVSIVYTTTPAQAISLLEQWRYLDWELPRLIVTDLFLPKPNDGLALVESIKALDPPVCWIPLVMMSASSQATHISFAYQAGVSSYIVKAHRSEDDRLYLAQLLFYWWEISSVPPLKYF